MKKVPNESKSIYNINIFIVDSWCIWFLYGGHLNIKTNENDNYFRRILLENQIKSVIILILYCILLFSICFSSL